MAKTATAKGKTSKKAPAAKSPKPPPPSLAGYLVLANGKPLALTTAEGSPKGGVLERSDRATLFARLNAAQAALKRTAKHHEGKPKALKTEACIIVRADQPPRT